MQDDKTTQNPDRLKDFSEGILPAVANQSATLIITGEKFSNLLMRDLVADLRSQDLSDKDILDLIIMLDELVETKEMNNDNIKDIILEALKTQDIN